MDSNALMVMKRELIHTTGTRGWAHIQKMAEDKIHELERQAIDEEDDAKGASLRRRAKAARNFWEAFTHDIEAVKRIEVTDTPASTADDDFYEVALD